MHFNTVLPLVRLHANAIKQPSFPEFSIDCKIETKRHINAVALDRLQTEKMLPCDSLSFKRSINGWVLHVNLLQCGIHTEKQ